MRNLMIIFAQAMFLLTGAVQADQLAEPQGEVILTVSGKLGLANLDGTAHFDLSMLRELPTRSFSTSTIWTEGEVNFTGVALSELLRFLNAEGNTIKALAINDYFVEIPADSVTEQDPMIAYLVNDVPMSRRQKGPLWIVYPYDSDPAFQTEVIYSRSIWQLDRLKIVQ